MLCAVLVMRSLELVYRQFVSKPAPLCGRMMRKRVVRMLSEHQHEYASQPNRQATATRSTGSIRHSELWTAKAGQIDSRNAAAIGMASALDTIAMTQGLPQLPNEHHDRVVARQRDDDD